MANRSAVYPSVRRNADGSIQRNYANSDFQRLMWKVFFYDRTYSKNDLAADLGVAADTVHAYANGDLRLHVDTARKVIEFVAERNPKDRRFIEYFMPPGFLAIPAGSTPVLKDIIDQVTDLLKKTRREERGAEGAP